MRKILFLGDSNGTKELLEKARAQGIYTIVTDYFEPRHSTAKLLADEYWMISTNKLDQLEKKCKSDHIQAVISGASDFNIEMSIQLCERLGLPCYCTYKIWKDSKDKRLFKAICKKTGVLTPRDYEVSHLLARQELEKINYPVIVKPIDLCSNAGVSYCHNEVELVEAYQYAESLSDQAQVIVERMLEGIEFCSYYALAEKEASFLTLVIRLPQPGYLKYCYSMNTTLNCITERYIKEMDPAVTKLLKEMGCLEGIACVQGILDKDNQFYAFEMCYCPETSYLISPWGKVCGFDAVSWLLDCAIGKKHSKDSLPLGLWKSNQRCANSYILFSKKDGVISEINGFDRIELLPNVEVRLHAHKGDYVKKYYPLGNIMFDAEDYEHTCEMIRAINRNIEIKNTLGENVIIYFDDFDTLEKIDKGYEASKIYTNFGRS